MTRPRLAVVKVGGSLLTAPQFLERLRAWLAGTTMAQPGTHFVLIVGGGQWVEAVRQLDAQSPLGDERAHWLCIDILDVTAGLVAAMLPELHLVNSFDALQRRLAEPGITLLQPSEFVACVEPTMSGTKLTTNWSVTSDSITARLAIVLSADELVLLKSVPPPAAAGTGDLASLAATGYVDSFLRMLQCELPPLRAEQLPLLEQAT